MSQTKRYLVTTDAATGATLKVEHVGDAGELTEVPAGTLAAPAGHVCPPSAVFHVYVGHGGVSMTPHASAGPGMGPGMGPGGAMGPGPTSAMGPGPTSAMGPGPTSGMGPGPGSAMGPGPTKKD
jgi:hypothetical protein